MKRFQHLALGQEVRRYGRHGAGSPVAWGWRFRCSLSWSVVLRSIPLSRAAPVLWSPTSALSWFCLAIGRRRNSTAMPRRWPDNTGVVLARKASRISSALKTPVVSHMPGACGAACRPWPMRVSGAMWPVCMMPRSISSSARPRTLNRLAQYKLGVLHETGHLTTADPPVAVFRYQQAANAGLPEAHIALARLFQHGIGVEADPVAAQQHLLAAIEARPALRLPARPAPSEAVADASSVEEPVRTAVSSGGDSASGGHSCGHNRRSG